MSNDPQRINGGDIADKARDMARDNPEHARSAIDTVEDAISQRTGGRFDSVIEAGGDFVEKQLGLPENSSADETPAPSPAPAPEDPQPQDPDGPATPGETPGGQPQETPGQPTPEPETTPTPTPAPSPAPAPGPSPDPVPAPDADPQTRPAETPQGEGRLPG